MYLQVPEIEQLSIDEDRPKKIIKAMFKYIDSN